MPASVLRRCKLPGCSVARVAADARRLLRALGEDVAEVTICLVDDREIQRLNCLYRGRDRPTDVLAFAMREGIRTPGDDAVLGDVVISLETAARQARRRAVPIADEVRDLLVHGMLHLLGYDHERSAAEARRMKAMQRRLRDVLRAGRGSISRAPCVPRPQRGL